MATDKHPKMQLTTEICSQRPKVLAVDIRLKFIEILSDDYFNLCSLIFILFRLHHPEISVKSVIINHLQFNPHTIC